MLSKDSTTTVDALKAQHHPSPGQIIAFFWGGPKSTQKCSADGGNSLSLSVGPGEVYLVSDRDGDTIKILVTKEKDPRIGMNGCVASISAVWAHLIDLDKIVVWKNISYLKTGIFDSVVGFYKSCGAEAKSVQTIDLNAGVQLDFSVGKGSVKLGTAAEYRLDETLALNKEHQYKRITIVSDESGRITYDSIISCPNYTPDQMKRRSVFQIESRSQPPRSRLRYPIQGRM